MARKNPNIIITGTPGVGKTTHAEQLAQATGLKHVSVNQIVKDEGFHEGKDEETGSWIVDEDKVCSEIEFLFGTRDMEHLGNGEGVFCASQSRCLLLAA